jgi:hypothetical protein
VLIDVLDQGIGMSEPELEDANKRVGPEAGEEVPVSRQMGLFVVGRMASRHGFSVRLFSDDDLGGLRAFVLVPAELVRTRDRRTPNDLPGSLGAFTPNELPAPPAGQPAANGSGVAHLLANPDSVDQPQPGPIAPEPGRPLERPRSAAADAFGGGAGRGAAPQPESHWDVSAPERTQPSEPVRGFGSDYERPEYQQRSDYQWQDQTWQDQQRPGAGFPSAGSSAAIPPLPPAISPAADLFRPTGSEPARGSGPEDSMPSLRTPGGSRGPIDPPEPIDPPQPTERLFDAPLTDAGGSSDWFDAGSTASADEPAPAGHQEAYQASAPSPPEPARQAEEPSVDTTANLGGLAEPTDADLAEFAAPKQPVDDAAFSWFTDPPAAPAGESPKSGQPAQPPRRPAAENGGRPAETSRPGSGSFASRGPERNEAPSAPPKSPEPSAPAMNKAPADSGPADLTSAGLPRRRPKSHLLPSLAQGPSPAPENSPSHRNPERTRGFLSNYQAGVRQGRPSDLQEHDNAYGQENP